MIQQPIKLGVPVREALAWIGIFANATKTPNGAEAANICHEICASFDASSEAELGVPAVDILCCICDALRDAGQYDAVAKMERVVVLLKEGGQRRIVGAIKLNGQSLAQLDASYENIRKRAAAG